MKSLAQDLALGAGIAAIMALPFLAVAGIAILGVKVAQKVKGDDKKEGS